MRFEPITNSPEILSKYWQGPTNMFARYYTYFQRCLQLFNEAKYLIALFGLGVFKSDIVLHWWMLAIGVVIGLPIMVIVGRWHLFRVQKATEFINQQHGTVTGYNGYNMQVEMIRLLEEISNKLK